MGLFITTLMMLLSNVPTQFALIRASALTVMTAVVHYSNQLLFYRFYRYGKTRYWLSLLLMVVLYSALRTLIEMYVLPENSRPYFLQYRVYRPLFYFVTTSMVSIISFVILYALSLADKEREMEQIISSHNEAKLQYLQTQINPHFLFNTMNNIYSLTLTKSDKASEMVLALTELLRFTIYQKAKEKVAVSDEAKQIDFLIKLFQLKSDEIYNISFNSNCSNQLIEPMILIPIVENCLKHCDFDLNPDAYAKMHLEANDGVIKFKAENTYQSKPVSMNAGGVGLRNIQERLRLIYGDNHQLKITKENKLFTIELELQWKSQ